MKHLSRHSPSGFEWGYSGSGPADLARSLVAAVMPDASDTSHIYQFVKTDIIATLDTDTWEMSSTRVLDSIARAKQGGTR